MSTDEPWWHQSEQDGDPGDGGGRHSYGEALGNGPQEAAKLFSAIRDRVLADPAAMKAAMQAMDVLSSFRGSASHPVSPGEAPECAYCPICQGIARAQNINPETVENLTATAINFAEALLQALTGERDPDVEQSVREVPLDDDGDEDEGDEGDSAIEDLDR